MNDSFGVAAAGKVHATGWLRSSGLTNYSNNWQGADTYKSAAQANPMEKILAALEFAKSFRGDVSSTKFLVEEGGMTLSEFHQRLRANDIDGLLVRTKPIGSAYADSIALQAGHKREELANRAAVALASVEGSVDDFGYVRVKLAAGIYAIFRDSELMPALLVEPVLRDPSLAVIKRGQLSAAVRYTSTTNNAEDSAVVSSEDRRDATTFDVQVGDEFVIPTGMRIPNHSDFVFIADVQGRKWRALGLQRNGVIIGDLKTSTFYLVPFCYFSPETMVRSDVWTKLVDMDA
jgi:hypothetical protein